MRSNGKAFLRPHLKRLALAAAIAAGAAAALAGPASAGGGHGHGHGFHHRHFNGPSFWHHRHAHRPYRSGTHFSFSFLAPPPVYAPRYYYGPPPVYYVERPAAYVTGCTEGTWRHPNGVVVRGIACRGPDGYWRMAD